MRELRINECLIGPSIRRLILRDHTTLEKWNDKEHLKGWERDRLGYKERRLQALLSQVLSKRNFEVIVESYFPKKLRGKGYRSCDLYAYQRHPYREIWIEIKSYSLRTGGRHVLINTFFDLSKLLTHTTKGNLLILWVLFYTDNDKQFSDFIREQENTGSYFLYNVTKRALVRCHRSGERGKARSPWRNLRRLFNHLDSLSAIDAIHSLKAWFERTGGRTYLVPISGLRKNLKHEWVKYGIFCGSIRC